MKSKKTFLTTTFLIFISLSHFAFAQTDYVIRLSGDTIKGSLKIIDYEQLERVQIKTDKGKTVLTGLEVRCLRKNNDLYRPVRFENTVRFMKVLIDGYLSLHAFNSLNQNSWDGRYLTKLDGTGMEIPNLTFKKSLGNYLSDCGDIKKRIENGELGKSDVEKIVGLYNTCMQNKTATPKPKAIATPSTSAENETVLAVKNLIAKVEGENFSSKNDALDILKDVQVKVGKNEPVPNYLMEGLKASLADMPSLVKELDTVIGLLKK